MTGRGRKHIPLSAMDMQILLSLMQGPNHGYAVINEIAERTGNEMRVGTSTLYAAIRRMLTDGWVKETGAPPDVERTDVRRRYYEVTGEGNRILRSEARRIDQLRRVLKRGGLLSDEVG